MIELDGVAKFFGPMAAVETVSLEVAAGDFCVLLGPSGCGKSTVLRMINAMIAPDRGRIAIRGVDIATLDPIALRRGVGYCIQSVGLFPHWTVEHNIAAVPRLLGWGSAKIAARMAEVVAAMQIDEALLPRYPRELSGGQQQRIGVARALAADPDIILMDEPFAALDPISRAALQDEMRRLHEASGKTFLFVTHDINEALRLATRIVVMNKGRVAQAGTPADILMRPVDEFVRGFLGRDELPLRLLDLVEIRDRIRPLSHRPSTTAIGGNATLRAALNMMLDHHVSRLAVADETGEIIGEISLADIVAGGAPQ
ncbi:ABC transporter related [Methylocella silvestris BL2]|uniref:ABC transporter related n=1 Tax=Methylocella silvestris (strain DSM 15510 / CIP 108128 / LMG 27833 / NCIMB 13906 / BL2) TaxID=395965 RepID=B8ERM4_METSB|nr:ABC transporter ATP-binding protein [Methylocella silvestris]ACK51076.1 ABC transporter related [Methylocella silvestris BL2]